MRKLFLLTYLMIIGNIILAQERKVIEFNQEVFERKSELPGDKTIKIEVIVQKINAIATTDTQKIMLVAGWMYDHISFDAAKFERGGSISDYRTVLKTRKGICSDYTALFAEFCNRLGIKNEIIEGYVQEFEEHKTEFKETNHAWNVVKLGKEWFHCDVFWMSGGVKQVSGKFVFEQRLNDELLLTQSKVFLDSHIPADPMWQLSYTPLSMKDMIQGMEWSADTAIKFDYNKAIDKYRALSPVQKSLHFADNAYQYNKDNSRIVVVNYFNAAIDLLNVSKGDKKIVATSRKYLLKAQKHLPAAAFPDKRLQKQIETVLKSI